MNAQVYVRSVVRAEQPRYAVVLLGLLTLAMVFSFLDRVILGLLIKPIRSDLTLTDTQFSLLFGLVFAGPYVVASLISGRLADRFRRLSVLRGAILLWSASTMLCMMATSFWHLAAARLCVALGEAALLPCAWSLLADCFAPRQLGRAYSIMIMGANLGTGVALIFGGALYEAIAAMPLYHLPLIGAIKPWQMTFLVVGAPGAVLALIIGAFPEPPRRGIGPKDEPTGVREALGSFARQWQAYLALVVGFALSTMSLQTAQIFGVQHFVRTYGMSLAEAGLRIGVPVAVLGSCGLWIGGWLNDYWKAKGRSDAAFLVGTVSAIGLLTGTMIAMLTRNLLLAQSALLMLGLFSNFPFGAVASGMMSITPQRRRGTITAIYTLFATLFGAGMSPLLTALLTDRVFASEQSVGHSVAIVSTFSSLVAILLFLWGRPYLRRAALAAT
jgi:MFS family permease